MSMDNSALNNLSSPFDDAPRLSAAPPQSPMPQAAPTAAAAPQLPINDPSPAYEKELNASAKRTGALMDQQGQAASAAAGEQAALAGQESADIQGINKQKTDYPEFTPTPENKDNLFRLFALTAAATFMSGGQRDSGTAAMSNITNAVKGYSEGREDLHTKEMEAFKVNMEKVKAHNQLMNEKVKDIVGAYTIDRVKAEQKATVLSASLQAGIEKEALKAGNLDKILRARQNANTIFERFDAAMYRGRGAASSNALMIASSYGEHEYDRIALKKLFTGKIDITGQGGGLARAMAERSVTKWQEMMGLSDMEVVNLPTQHAAQAKAYDNVAKWGGMLKKSQENLKLDMQSVVDAAKAVPLSELPIANRAIISGDKFVGDPATTKYMALLNKVKTEYTRLMAGPLSNAMLTDSATEKANSIIGGIETPEQLLALQEAFGIDIDNTDKAIKETESSLMDLMSDPHSTSRQEATAATGGQAPVAGSKGAISQDRIKAYALKHKATIEEAEKHAIDNGFTVSP